MPPKRASKRRSSKSTTPAVAVKQQRSEGQSASLPESTTPTPQFSPTVLGEIISTAISGALQSAGLGILNISPAVGEQRISNPSMPQPTVVEDAASREIAELTNAVAPGRLTFASDRPDDTFSSVTFDLESRVSDRVKAKIWANEYVDFASLLYVAPEESKYRLSVTHSHDQPSLCLDQWVTAFNVFVAVYTIRVPNAISSLMKYCEVVRDIASKQGNWRYFDEQFRFLRQSKPDRYPWDNVAWELWHQAMHSSLITSRQNSSYDFRARQPNQRPFQSFPRGVCWRFHSGQFCRGCNFKHSCFKCGAVHPASQCNANRAHSNPNNATLSIPSGSDSQGRTSVLEPLANTGKARPSRLLS